VEHACHVCIIKELRQYHTNLTKQGVPLLSLLQLTI